MYIGTRVHRYTRIGILLGLLLRAIAPVALPWDLDPPVA